jgi:HlyD family secretion protein
MKNQIMNQVKKALWVIMSCSVLASCGNKNDTADAYGNFESDEVIVSAQAQGVLIAFDIVEGGLVNKDQLAGKIDSSSFAIKKEQLFAQQKVIEARMRNLDAQIRVQEEQRINMVREVSRMENLLRDNAATRQQYDDISGKLKVLDSQTGAIESQRSIISGELSVLKAQVDEINNQLAKCHIMSPIAGTILEKYVDAGELVTPGKALFKIADLQHMELKVYISGSQLSSVAIGDTVTVYIDGRQNTLQPLKGQVSWISSQVEFTPKIIQTKEERVNMVYAVKIRVNNDGSMKIGMPGEVLFTRANIKKVTDD